MFNRRVRGLPPSAPGDKVVEATLPQPRGEGSRSADALSFPVCETVQRRRALQDLRSLTMAVIGRFARQMPTPAHVQPVECKPFLTESPRSTPPRRKRTVKARKTASPRGSAELD